MGYFKDAIDEGIHSGLTQGLAHEGVTTLSMREVLGEIKVFSKFRPNTCRQNGVLQGVDKTGLGI